MNTTVGCICCSANACAYNMNEKCTASKVDVGTKNAKTSCETECATFIQKS